MQNDIEIVVRPENFCPQVAFASSFSQCLFKNTVAEREFATDINESQVAFDSVRGNDDAFNQLVRVAFNDDAILAGSRFAFVGVAAQIDGLAGCLGNKAPLQPGRKSGAAAAAQPGSLCRFN